MSYPLEKYKYFVHGNEVVAVSTYCRQRVRGVAKCSPEDDFDLATGKALAAARCDKKICERRLKRATQKHKAAEKRFLEVTEYLHKMQEYQMDAEYDLAAANRTLDTLTKVI